MNAMRTMKTTRPSRLLRRAFLLLALALMPAMALARTVEIDVNGLVCAFCAQGIEKTLRKFPAAADVFVSLEHRLVAVELKPNQDIADAELRKAIVDAGYSVVAIRRGDAALEAIRQRVGKE